MAFSKAASQFSVGESDFLVLKSFGIKTSEAFALRIPSKEDVEEFLKSTLCPSAAYESEDGTLQTFPRAPQVPWQSFRMSEEAAAMRKLWPVAKKQCKNELEWLAAGDETAKRQSQHESTSKGRSPWRRPQ